MFNKSSNAKTCPLLKKPCIGSDCMWATRLTGTNPQDGQHIDDEACAVSWLPMLLIENVKSSNETGAAIESLRNETLKTQKRLNDAQEMKLKDIAHRTGIDFPMTNRG